jgi:hypothetical protein
MAEQTPLPSESLEAVDPFAAGAGGPSVFAKIRILLFVTLVIAAECLLAWLYLPSASKTAALAEAAMGADSQAVTSTGQDQSQKPADEVADWVEVDLGEFSVVSYQPAAGTTLRIDFHLWGMVHRKDHNEFLALMEDHLHRFREQIHFTIRSAEITDLTDARLGLIKRKALERTNKILGKPLLRVIIFDDFSMIEQ